MEESYPANFEKFNYDYTSKSEMNKQTKIMRTDAQMECFRFNECEYE